jgi:hypothetical protein
VATVWLREEGLPWFDGRFPHVREQIAARVAIRRTGSEPVR